MTVAELRRHIDHRFVTKHGLKRELRRFATKEDLKAFATKEDLTAFATKEDLKAFPTREDLNRELRRYAVKDDLNDLRRTVMAMRHEMRKGFADLREDFLRVVDNHERRLSDLEARQRV